MSIDIVGIKAKLATQLVTELGLYTATNGSTVPAIYIVNNLDIDPPRDVEISGIECLVYRVVDRVPQACFQGVVDRYQVSVELIQHDRTKNLNNALETLFCYWQRIRIAWHRRQTEENLEQVKLYLPGEHYFNILK
ncbi:hypothetical protein [Chamaesiphon sp. VAR_48_metabat_135_sub]|uniref:hypothetical protein n=1 Tax=Chamaesiphon sp. VAR_48_metabat_135_sub TaxID=2964699 RepID=UPI00286AF110|nr:hypothetical protein [Chamaesiphon sp. VAR_48_metabat_135_sub]